LSPLSLAAERRAHREIRWCSASWFAKNARPSFVKTVRSMKIDAVSIYDDYTP
jgi:hypothetical protein